MAMLVLSALFFVGLHLGVAGTRLRDGAVRGLGAGGYSAAFSAGSLLGLAWLVNAYKGAPYIATWGALEWWKPFAIALMLPAFLLAVVGLTTPNPTAVAQEARLAEPPRGVVRITRHPFLVGVGLWASVHLVGNGDLASAVLFGALALVCFAGTASIDAKRRRLLEADRWEPFAAQTSIVPFAAIARGRTSLDWRQLVTWRLAVAATAYALMLGGHAHIVGVSPFPR